MASKRIHWHFSEIFGAPPEQEATWGGYDLFPIPLEIGTLLIALKNAWAVRNQPVDPVFLDSTGFRREHYCISRWTTAASPSKFSGRMHSARTVRPNTLTAVQS
jgi:hypothetical protein